MGNLGVPELLIIAGVIILLFGARKLPEMARSLGKSAKAFKEETKGMRGKDIGDDDAATDTASTPAQPVQQQLPQAQPHTQTQTQNGTPVVESVEQSQQNKNAT